MDTSSRDGVVAPFPYNDANNTSPALTAGVTLPGSIFEAAAYKGAFASSASSANWMAGWSSIGGSVTSGSTPLLIVDSSAASSSTSSGTSVVLHGISTNAMVTPSAMMVAGIQVKGGTKKVVFQVQANGTYPNQGYVTDPILTVTNSSGTVIAIVDDWASGPTSFDATYYQSSYLTELTSSSYAMTGSKEAAIVMNLPAGSYTALVGSNGESAKAVVAAFAFE